MAPAPAKKAGAALGKKAGPLPIWAWLALAGGAVLLLILMRKNTRQSGSGVQLVTGQASRAAQGAAYGGYPAGATAPAQGLNDEVLYTLAGSLSELSDRQRELGLSLGEQVANLDDRVTQSVTGSALSSPAVVTPTAAAAGSAPPPPVSQPAPQRYYTYKPGKAPAGRKGDEAPPGKRLGFVAGRGYYVIG